MWAVRKLTSGGESVYLGINLLDKTQEFVPQALKQVVTCLVNDYFESNFIDVNLMFMGKIIFLPLSKRLAVNWFGLI